MLVHNRKETLFNKKRSFVSTPGHWFPRRTWKHRVCQQLWKFVGGGSILYLDI